MRGWTLTLVLSLLVVAGGTGAAAAQLAADACAGAERTSCIERGLDYLEGRRVPVDEVRAAAIYLRLCHPQPWGLCQRLGRVFTTPEHTLGLLKRACNQGELAACGELAMWLLGGDGVDRDEVGAVQLLVRTCRQGGAGACRNLGLLHEAGTGVDRDEERALALFRRGCEGGDRAACDRVGQALLTGALGAAQDPALAAAFLDKGCGRLGCLMRLYPSPYGDPAVGTGATDDRRGAACRSTAPCGIRSRRRAGPHPAAPAR